MSGIPNQLDEDMWYLYHGTGEKSALALLAGAPLALDVATSLKIDGRPGFYLAEHLDDAVFFAARRAPTEGAGLILQYGIGETALGELISSGAVWEPIPGGTSSSFSGRQLVVPPTAFALFDSLRAAGQISVELVPLRIEP